MNISSKYDSILKYKADQNFLFYNWQQIPIKKPTKTLNVLVLFLIPSDTDICPRHSAANPFIPSEYLEMARKLLVIAYVTETNNALLGDYFQG